MNDEALTPQASPPQPQIIAAQAQYSIVPTNVQEQIDRAKQMIELNTTLLSSILVENVDYMVIPGTQKPTLLKNGAEVICKVYSLAVAAQDVISKTELWDQGIFCYTVTCTLVHIESGRQVATGLGAASSEEKKYKFNRNGQPMENPADNINTLVKMAGKRAFVDATLKATCASRVFTQDLEERKTDGGGRSYSNGGGYGGSEPATGAQYALIRKSCGNDMNNVSRAWGVPVTTLDALNLSKSEASELIVILQGKKPPRNAPPTQQQFQAPQAYTPPASPPHDPYQEPYAPPQIYTPPTPSYQPEGQMCGCSNCGQVIPQAIADYSQRTYGRPLCLNCQKN